MVRDIRVVWAIGMGGVVWMVGLGLRVNKERKVTQESKSLEKKIAPNKTHYLSLPILGGKLKNPGGLERSVHFFSRAVWSRASSSNKR